jgi:hypothetical protein
MGVSWRGSRRRLTDLRHCRRQDRADMARFCDRKGAGDAAEA